MDYIVKRDPRPDGNATGEHEETSEEQRGREGKDGTYQFSGSNIERSSKAGWLAGYSVLIDSSMPMSHVEGRRIQMRKTSALKPQFQRRTVPGRPHPVSASADWSGSHKHAAGEGIDPRDAETRKCTKNRLWR